MNPDQLDLARRLAAHPRFEWGEGLMVHVDPAHTFQGSPVRGRVELLLASYSGVPLARIHGRDYALTALTVDLTDAATGGVLLDMLGPGWTVITRIGKVDAHPTGCAGPPGVSGATVAEACARALLAEWETTPATPETTAS